MKSRKDLPNLLNQLNLTGLGVEVGVCQGSFAEHILSHWEGVMLFLVDPWMEQGTTCDASDIPQEDHMANMRKCKERMVPFRARHTFVRRFSPIASEQFLDSSLDFVYIDARHDYRSVDADLRAWWPKVKVGGVFSGHDYKNSFVRNNLVEVKRAVDNFALEFGLKVESTTEDNLPSWYIIK